MRRWLWQATHWVVAPRGNSPFEKRPSAFPHISTAVPSRLLLPKVLVTARLRPLSFESAPFIRIVTRHFYYLIDNTMTPCYHLAWSARQIPSRAHPHVQSATAPGFRGSCAMSPGTALLQFHSRSHKPARKSRNCFRLKRLLTLPLTHRGAPEPPSARTNCAHCTRSAACNSIRFIYLLHTSVHIPGGGSAPPLLRWPGEPLLAEAGRRLVCLLFPA